jgi:CheY-like chemotaxis protein
MNNPFTPARYKKVLVIDDDEVDLFITKRLLQSALFANEIVLKKSIAEALEYIANLIRDSEDLPEIIFLDLNMPGEDSFDFLEQLRQIKALIGVHFRVLILTNVTDRFQKKQGKENYSIVEGVIEKPLKPDTLENI